MNFQIASITANKYGVHPILSKTFYICTFTFCGHPFLYVWPRLCRDSRAVFSRWPARLRYVWVAFDRVCAGIPEGPWPRV